MFLQLHKSVPHDKCGVCGISDHPEAAKLTYFSLYALQHRGQKGAGLISHNGNRTMAYKGVGLVPEIFTEENLLSLKGDTALGHVLGTDSENVSMADIQPFTASHRGRAISVAHNGSITNIQALQNEIAMDGAIFHSGIDSEVVVHLLARCGDLSLDAALLSVFTGIKGAFSMLLMVDDTLIAVRDPHGFRPLCLGRLPEGGYVVASETCALDLIEAQYLREIEPGEILMIDADGPRSVYLTRAHSRFCVFEQVYFARPDSTIFGIDVYQSRKRMGEALARECRVDADMVIPFPDSGTFAALGYAQATRIPFEMGLIRNHYIGRTFLPSARTDRDLAVRVKLNPVRSLLHGKRVVIVDDSAISGATVASKVRALRKAGALGVHLLVSCPPIRFPCDYGIHFPASDKLLATGKSADRIRDELGLDTLHYLSLEGLLMAAGGGESSYCTACMDSNSPLAHGTEMA
ncbi:MAG: amidophosphoribosyltransferase [Deltaproteobacteria bacterium]|nr:amidophosphoribosyltransferase [Deltaproteobacteria bacterium]